MRPALAAVLGGVQAAAEPRARAPRGGSRATSSSGAVRRARSASTSQRDQHLVDEGAGARLQLGLLGRHATSGTWLADARAICEARASRARDSDAPSARERILDAAVRLIAREGIDDVRIARIATDAGVSAALVHYHFASRDALLAEALEHSYELRGRRAHRRRRGGPGAPPCAWPR